MSSETEQNEQIQLKVSIRHITAWNIQQHCSKTASKTLQPYKLQEQRVKYQVNHNTINRFEI
jgi:hypothetical protein